jgi:hypothetical protein
VAAFNFSSLWPGERANVRLAHAAAPFVCRVNRRDRVKLSAVSDAIVLILATHLPSCPTSFVNSARIAYNLDGNFLRTPLQARNDAVFGGRP